MEGKHFYLGFGCKFGCCVNRQSGTTWVISFVGFAFMLLHGYITYFAEAVNLEIKLLFAGLGLRRLYPTTAAKVISKIPAMEPTAIAITGYSGLLHVSPVLVHS